jgi:hypothetical protein
MSKKRFPSGPFGVLLLVGAAGFALLLLLRPNTPPLARADYERAERLWAAQNLEDYSVRVLKERDRLAPELFTTTVRGHKATQLLMDGTPLIAKPTYTVDGLFEIIQREVEMLEDSQEVGAAKIEGGPEGVVLRARFHPELGLPLVFKRLATNEKSFVLTVEELAVPDQGTLYP